jgi:hypothetical protein
VPEYALNRNLRICAHCELEFFSEKSTCPRCEFASYNLTFVVGGLPIVSDSSWITCRDQPRKRRGADYPRQVYLAFQPTRHPDVCTCFDP